jgi:outer membrane immunogenic protein
MLRGLCYYAALAVLALAFGLLANIYIADESHAGSFTGCYGGGAVGYSAALTDTSLDATGLGAIASIDSLGMDGGSVTALAGCDLQISNSPFVVGVWGDHSWSEADFSVSLLGAPGALLETGVDTSWAVGARVGYVVVPGALLYVKGGYTQAELNDISFPALGPGAPVLSVPTLDGYVLGGGGEVQLGNGLALQLDYSYADYEKADIALAPGLSLGLDTDIQTARVGLLYRFGGREDFVIPAIDLPASAAPTKHKPLK